MLKHVMQPFKAQDILIGRGPDLVRQVANGIEIFQFCRAYHENVVHGYKDNMV
jgi:hypothetical protein